MIEIAAPIESPQAQADDAFDVAQGVAPESASPTRLAMRRFFRHRAAVISMVVLGLILLACILAPLLAPYQQNERVSASGANYLSPRADYWFGTDSIGRDLFSRILWGGRVSLFIGIAVAISAGFIGTAVGAFAGYRGGRLDNVLMRITDMALAFPILVILLIVVQLPSRVPVMEQILGAPGSLRLMITLLTLTGWMVTARIVRGVIKSLKEKEFVEAARALGATDNRIIGRHLLPNALGPIVVAMTFTVAAAIAAESTLSYFGFGLGPTKASWGNLLADSKNYITSGKWWLVLFPSMALLLTILSINFIGDGLRDAFDPKQSKGRA